MILKSPTGEISSMVDAVEATRVKTLPELIDVIRLQLAGNASDLKELDRILNDISNCRDAYKEIWDTKTQAENNTQLDDTERADILRGANSRLGYKQNFFLRSMRDLKGLCEKNRIDGAGELAFLIVNGYRETVGAPPFDKKQTLRA